MKVILVTLLISLVALVGFAQSQSYLTEVYGPVATDLDKANLDGHKATFCETAPGLISKAYGQVVVSVGDCKAGVAQVRVKNNQRYFLVTGVKSYYGSIDLDLVTTLTEKDGKDIFGSVGVIGLPGE